LGYYFVASLWWILAFCWFFLFYFSQASTTTRSLVLFRIGKKTSRHRTATRTIQGCTPYEIWHKEKPSISHLIIFGVGAYIHIPKELRTKLSPKSRKGIFMGYSTTSKGYRVWNNELCWIEESRDVLANKELHDADSSSKSEADPTQWFDVANKTAQAPQQARGAVLPPTFMPAVPQPVGGAAQG
jgi:hypothetical protein